MLSIARKSSVMQTAYTVRIMLILIGISRLIGRAISLAR
jgi:hypothetical protein